MGEEMKVSAMGSVTSMPDAECSREERDEARQPECMHEKSERGRVMVGDCTIGGSVGRAMDQERGANETGVGQ